MHPKRKVIFQPSIFRCYVSFRECNLYLWALHDQSSRWDLRVCITRPKHGFAANIKEGIIEPNKMGLTKPHTNNLAVHLTRRNLEQKRQTMLAVEQTTWNILQMTGTNQQHSVNKNTTYSSINMCIDSLVMAWFRFSWSNLFNSFFAFHTPPANVVSRYHSILPAPRRFVVRPGWGYRRWTRNKNQVLLLGKIISDWYVLPTYAL